jgi:hypothetical protein
MIVTINNRKFDAQFDVVESIERGTLTDFNIEGLIRTVSVGQIELVGKAYEYICQLLCLDGCSFLDVYIEICGNHYSFKAFNDEVVLDKNRSKVTITLTDDNFGAYLKNNIDKEYPVNLTTTKILGKEFRPDRRQMLWVTNSLGDKVYGQHFYGIRFVDVFEEVLKRATKNRLKLDVVPTEIDEWYLTTFSAIRNLRFLDERNPNIVVSLKCLLETLFKLRAYSFVIDGNKFSIVERSGFQEPDIMVQAASIERFEKLNTENVFASIKTGDDSHFIYANNLQHNWSFEDDDGVVTFRGVETVEGDTSAALTDFLNKAYSDNDSPTNHAPSTWINENDCANSSELDLSSGCISWSSNAAESQVYSDDNKLGDRLFLVETQIVSGNVQTVFEATQMPYHLTGPGSPSPFYNRFTWNPNFRTSKIFEFWKGFIRGGYFIGRGGNGNWHFQQSDGVALVQDIVSINVINHWFDFNVTLQTNNGIDSKYCYTALSGESRRIFLSGTISIDGLPTPTTNGYEVVVSCISANGNLIWDIVRSTAMSNNGDTFAFTIDRRMYIPPSATVCVKVVQSEPFFPAEDNVVVEVQGLVQWISNYADDQRGREETGTDNNIIEADIDTYINPCCSIPLRGFAGVDGKGFFVKKLERDIKSGKTKINAIRKCLN